MSQQSCRFLAAAILAFAVPDAGSAEPTRWNCLYAPSDGEFIACQLVSTPVEGPAALPLRAGHERLPRLVREIRNDPQSLDSKTIVIPLHNAPIDMARTGQLARAVMCGARPGCEVAFHAERQRFIEPTHMGGLAKAARPSVAVRR